ncbi:MAG: sugar phosphate isomerase/epimerase, partial [Chloroflexota bacterium]
MLLGLNGATTMKADLVTDIRVAAQAGYDYLEVWAEKLDDFLKENSIAQLKEMLDKSELKPLSINALDDFT